MADLTQTQWVDQLAEEDNAVILDVRTMNEVREGYIPDMMHLDIYIPGAFMDAARELDPSKSYYIYCRSGARSGQACAILNSLGIKKTYNLVGGIMEWKGETTV